MENSRSTKKSSKDGKLSKYLKSAMRILSKARDFYIRSMTECSDKVSFATALGVGQPIGLPRSYSVSSSKASNDDDYRELVRAASTRGLLVGGRSQQVICRQTPIAAANSMPRSHSVGAVLGIGRIDEDKPCDRFDDDVKVKTSVYPRSRSHAVRKRTAAAMF